MMPFHALQRTQFAENERRPGLNRDFGENVLFRLKICHQFSCYGFLGNGKKNNSTFKTLQNTSRNLVAKFKAL